MDEAGIKPEDVKSLNDLKRLPFTTKQDMRDNYPFGLFAVDKSQLARIHASSGTTGKPTVVGYTKRIWKRGLNVLQGLRWQAVRKAAMFVRYASDTVCSQVRWAYITALKE